MVRAINRVNSLDVPETVPGNASHVETKSQAPLSKHIKHIKSGLDWSAAILKVVNSVGSFLKNISLPFKVGFKCTKIPNILLSPYKVQELAESAKKIVHGRTLYDKVKAGLKSITNINALLNAASAFVKIFITAKLIAGKFGCWLPIVDMIDVFVGPINIFLKGESAFKLNNLRRELNNLNKEAQESSNPRKKAKILDQALEKLEREDIKALHEKLSISKKADLVSRVSGLRTALKTPGSKTQATKEASDLLKTLSSRVTKQFGYELAELVNKVAITVGAVFVVFTPLFMVGSIILCTTAVVSLVMMAGRAMLIHKNPFDQYSRSKAQAILDAIIPSRKEALNLRKQVQKLSAEKEDALYRLHEQEKKIKALEAKVRRNHTPAGTGPSSSHRRIGAGRLQVPAVA
jgi:hypothetical protein